MWLALTERTESSQPVNLARVSGVFFVSAVPHGQTARRSA